LLTEHRVLVQEELDDVLAGRRILTEKDFLGSKERKKRKLAAATNEAGVTSTQKEDGENHYSRYFFAMDQKLLEIRRVEMMRSFYIKRKEAEDAAKQSKPTS
jgi:hypothetical protein